jgi:MoxR-like ATPase
MAKNGFYNDSVKYAFCRELETRHGKSVTRGQALAYADEIGGSPPYWFLNDKSRNVGRGMYSTSVETTAPVLKTEPITVLDPHVFSSNAVAPEGPQMVATVTPIRRNNQTAITENLIPEREPTYVEFGQFDVVERIITSRIFYPVFITGLSGNGKTTMIEQVCAKLSRECIRVNITEETDEDDLVGGNTLVDGSIVYREGPVLTAMRRGAVLILDEVDLNATKIMCLQSILEGKPYHIKKTGEKVYPAVGFNVFATANTKGRGSDDGRFVGTKLMNEAFLERYPITIEQDYPPVAVEKSILIKNLSRFNIVDVEFADNLVKWANITRKCFAEGAANEVISTRRLVHIISAYAIFNNRAQSVEMCLNRFDSETKASFLDLYTKIDASANAGPKAKGPEKLNDIDLGATASAMTRKHLTPVTLAISEDQANLLVKSHTVSSTLDIGALNQLTVEQRIEAIDSAVEGNKTASNSNPF